MTLDKYESRRIRAEIRSALLEYWDPIGIKDEPNAQDEYDCCLADLLHLLMTHSTDQQLSNYLESQARDHMGIRANRDQIEQTIQALRQIRMEKQA